MEQTRPQSSILEFELSYLYPPSQVEVGFDSRSHEIIVEELKRHGFINHNEKPLIPFEIRGRNQILGPNEEGLYIVRVQYIRG